MGVLAVLALVALAGCSGLLGAGDGAGSPTLTPVPVPETDSGGATATPDGRVAGPDSTADRYAGLRPTCKRPPGLVVQIQVGALATNDPDTDAGIRTVWSFAAPSNREYTGPYPEFAELIRTSYTPLLEAERTTYWPVDRTGDEASRLVAVHSSNESVTYRWELRRQSTGRYEGCWMTVGVAQIDDVPVATVDA